MYPNDKLKKLESFPFNLTAENIQGDNNQTINIECPYICSGELNNIPELINILQDINTKVDFLMNQNENSDKEIWNYQKNVNRCYRKSTS